MRKGSNSKKRLIISYEKLMEELKEMFKEVYAEGYTSHIQKIEKPNGETIFVVPLETEDSVYMVKMDVRVDSKFSEEELDKEIFALPKDGDEFTPELEENSEDEKDHKEFELKHGDYEENDNDEEDDEEDEDDEEEEKD